MSIQYPKFLKVAYPTQRTLTSYRRIRGFAERLLKLIRVPQLRNLINRVISVARPSGKVFVISEPDPQIMAPARLPITIMSANLWHDWPRNRMMQQRLNCFVELINRERVDILLLQEICRINDFHVDKWLSEELGMAYIYSRSNGNAPEIGFEEGLAIFSRFPIKSHRLAQLSDQNNPFLRRMALGTCIKTGVGDFLAFSVHLGISGNQNKKQVTRLMKWVEEEAGSIPAVIGGDFNANEDTPQIRSTKTLWHDSFRAVNPTDRGYSHEIRWPWGNILRRSRLDYLFLRSGNHDWRVSDARYVDDYDCELSDHKPILIRASF